MTKKAKQNSKDPQLTLDEYQKLKAKEAKKRFRTYLPWLVKIIIAVPILILIINLLVYFFIAKDRPY